MWNDPIVAEVRKTREEHSARFGHDLDRIYRELKLREESSGRHYVSYPARRPEPPAAQRQQPRNQKQPL